MYNGIILSDSPPSHVTGYAWIKVNPDGSVSWYSYNKDMQEWVLDRTEPAYSLLVHLHPELGNVNFIGTVSADSAQGITGSRTLGGYKITFTKGLLTGFEPV